MNLHNAQRLKDINPACKFYRQPHFCRKILQTKLILILSLQQDLCGASRRWVVRPQSPKVFFLSSRLNCCGFLFPGCRLVFGKTGRCVFKNIGKDCLFRPRGDKLPFFCYLSIVASREERIQVMFIF